MVDTRTLTADDRNELFAAYVTRYREGEFGPLTFKIFCVRIGVSADDINAARDLHVDECAKNMRNGKGC